MRPTLQRAGRLGEIPRIHLEINIEMPIYDTKFCPIFCRLHCKDHLKSQYNFFGKMFVTVFFVEIFDYS